MSGIKIDGICTFVVFLAIFYIFGTFSTNCQGTQKIAK